MEVEKRRREIVVSLTREDVFDLQSGNTIHGDRPAVTMPDAKIEVTPLSAIEPDDSLRDMWNPDRLEKAQEALLKVYLWSDGDLQIFVPAIKLTDVRIAGATLPRESIKTPGTKNGKALVRHVIPTDGVRLNFGGTLKTINIPSFFA
jgi:hypothetical protein